MPAMLRAFGFMAPCVLWIFLMRNFVLGVIPVNMDTNTIYGVAKFYFNNILNGTLPLWEPFVSLGRPFYAIAICNLFNPVTQLVPLCKLAGINYANAFVAYMVVYFFIGCAGFYLLTLAILKSRAMAYLAYVALMFSSFGASMFTQLTFLELVVPTIWFFFFLLCFARQQNKGHFLGLSFAGMVLISSYLPFYFLTVALVFILVFVFLYAREASDFCMNVYRFIVKHWVLVLFCAVGIMLAAAPLLAYKTIDASGEAVAPGRHCQYTSAQECFDRTMGRQGGMSYDEITRSGTLGERLDLQYLLGNLDKITYGSDSLFFLPVWIYVILGLSFFLRLTRLTVLLSAMTVILGLVACGHASGLLGFLYRHIFFFSYFRNLFLVLKHFQGVPAVSFVTLGASAVALAVYYAGGFRLSRRLWTGLFAVLLIVQPAWILRAYALNAMEFKSILPSMHVKPVFGWLRPEKPAVDTSRIYQFVHYEDFWY